MILNTSGARNKIGAKYVMDSSVYLSSEARMGKGCTIGQGSRLHGKVTLGDRVRIDANVTLYGSVNVGDHVYIGSNCTLGHFDRKTLRRIVAGGKTSSYPNSLQIGEHCVIRQGCVIYSQVKIGPQVEFGHNVVVRENVKIGERTLVGTGVVIDGESNIGKDVSIQTGVYISRRSKVHDRVFLGPRCVLLNDKYMMLQKPRLVGPVIGEGSAIGGNSTLLPGVRVGKMAVIGAGAVVTCNVPDRTVYVGVPAKKLKITPRGWHSLLGR